MLAVARVVTGLWDDGDTMSEPTSFCSCPQVDEFMLFELEGDLQPAASGWKRRPLGLHGVESHNVHIILGLSRPSFPSAWPKRGFEPQEKGLCANPGLLQT